MVAWPRHFFGFSSIGFGEIAQSNHAIFASYHMIRFDVAVDHPVLLMESFDKLDHIVPHLRKVSML